MTARRHALKSVNTINAQHAGLAFHRFLESHEGVNGDTANHAHTQDVAALPIPAIYPQAFRRWEQAMTALDALTFTATTKSPLAIGLGSASVTEVGVTLHHTYGVPYLPGTALKGLARRAARAHGLSEETMITLFGNAPRNNDKAADAESTAAFPTYWDGWLHPHQPHTSPLQHDVITVHHPKYYNSHGKDTYPTDFDSPNPVAFLSVPAGTRFQLAISCPGRLDWAAFAAEHLQYGLKYHGLGAKTNAGYGLFTIS